MKKNIIQKGFKFLFDSRYRVDILAGIGFFRFLDDRKYLNMIFQAKMGATLDLAHPQTFNEKLQWLKLYDRKPEYTTMVDKFKVREYIAERLGEEYLIPLLGVWNDPDEIDFDALPNQFVLKCNHNSGLGMCICKDKAKLDIAKVKAELRKGLKQDYYLTGREWPYKNVERKIIAEKYMVDDGETRIRNGGKGELTDYKFFCFNGYVDCVMVCLERSSQEIKFYFFDRSWNLLRYNIRGKNAPIDFTVPKPINIDEMFDIAEKLSQGLPFARVDLYSVSGKTYFGEITFFPDSGFDANLLSETDRRWGEMIVTTQVISEVE